MQPEYSTQFNLKPYECEVVSPLIRRICCNNPSPFTFKGTVTYIVGRGRVVVIDPGPEDPKMIEALFEATKGETIEAVLITHTHRDHSPNAKHLKAKTYGEGVHRPSRDLALGEINALDAAGDKEFKPDIMLKDGEKFDIAGLRFEAITTPGHCANHMVFAFENENVLFSGDHIMAWSTSIVAPPDGAMGDYMASLEKLLGRGETTHFPGHGGVVENPQRFMRALLTHRKMREEAIFRQVEKGVSTIPEMVKNIYEGLNPMLIGAASLSVYAHLEELYQKKRVKCEGNPLLTSIWTL
jgi:glyoxylase-like metal-dependent hydrolase (beta-lactamase superfamily II)